MSNYITTTSNNTWVTSGFTFPTVTSSSPAYYHYTTPPTYNFDYTVPSIQRKIAFFRMPDSFHKKDLIVALSRLPKDAYIINTFYENFSKTTVFMLASEKFALCEQGSSIPEIVIVDKKWVYKIQADFTKRIEEGINIKEAIITR